MHFFYIIILYIEENKQIKAILDAPIVVEKGLEIAIKNDTTVIANGIVE